MIGYKIANGTGQVVKDSKGRIAVKAYVDEL